MNASVRFANGRLPSSSPLDRRAGSSARRTHVDFDEVPSPRPRKSLVSSMRRSSTGSPLHSLNFSPDLHDDEPFDADDGGGDIEMDAEMEYSGSRSKSSKQQATTRRANTSNVVQNESDDDDIPKAQSKGKARMETQEEDVVVEEEISRGLSDVDMQQDEDEEVAEPPPKKPPREKRPRKKGALPDVPCKSTLTAMRNTQPYSLQYRLKTRPVSEEASDFATNHSSGGGWRK
jgi:centromere protein C